MDRQKYIFRTVLIFAVSYAAVAMGLVALFTTHYLSLRGLGFAALGLMIVGVLVLTRFFRKAQKYPSILESGELTTAAAKRIRRQIWSLRLYVAILIVGLIVGLSDIESLPVISVVVGVAINQLLMWSCIRQIIRLRKRLKGEAVVAS